MDNQAIVVSAPRSMEVAEIESQIATAKLYPRNIAIFKDKLMSMANLDQETAEGCYYAMPRGGKAVDGPSIRLAEIALACYGNCCAEADVLSEDDRFIYAMGQVRDLENNIAVRVKVRRRITKADTFICEKCTTRHKKMPYDNTCPKCKSTVVMQPGERYNDDMIAVTANAACSIALRNAIFRVVPGAYIRPVFEQVKLTAVGKAKSLGTMRADVMKRLLQFGVTEERILGVIGRKSIEEVTKTDVATLIGLGTSIKDGDVSIENAFPLTGFAEVQADVMQDIDAAMATGSDAPEKTPPAATQGSRDPDFYQD